MAIVRKHLHEIDTTLTPIDRAKIEATTEEDIRRHMIEDGQDPDEEMRLEDSISPRQVRRNLDLDQEEIAARLGIPIATWRDWEENRVIPDPAARTLMRLMAKDGRRLLALLAG